MKPKLWIWMLVFLVVFFGLSVYGINGFDQSSEMERVKIIEDSIIRAAIQCYAIEGSYPPDLAYLEMHYGLILNETSYFYHYEIIASNILPNIAVYRRWR